MAFTISNLESVKEPAFNQDLDGDDWKSLVDQNARKDEISMAKEFMRGRQKKEEYK